MFPPRTRKSNSVQSDDRVAQRSYKRSVLASLCVLLFTAFGMSTARAYDPPIGIPEPVWGAVHPIDSQAPGWPSGWPAGEVDNYYYVDNTDPNATDSNNAYGYPDKPRATIAEITYAAGAYVEVHGGPYTDAYINLTFHGTAGQPCWFRGTGSSLPVISGTAIVRNDSSYAIMEYLDFNGGSETGLIIIGDSDHISVRNSKFRNKTYVGNRAGVSILPDSGKTVNDIVLYKNQFEELGDWATELDQDFHGIVPSLWGRDGTAEEYNVWILENTGYHISGNLVQVNAGNWTDSYKYLHHIYIGFNSAQALRQSPFGCKQASDIIMSQNIAHNIRRHGYQMGDGFTYQYRPNNLWIIFNKVYDCNFGIRQSAGDGWGSRSNTSYILGNVFYNIKPEDTSSYNPKDYWRTGVPISLWQGDMNRYVVNNTIYNCYNGINAIQTGSEGSYLEIAGNIIEDIDANSYFVSINENVDQDVDIDTTNVYDPGNVYRFRWAGIEYNSLANFQASTGECTNCSDSDPKITAQLDAKSFPLQDGSPAMNKIALHQAYATFYNLYGISIAKDIQGVTRPQQTAVDLGAYEYASGDGVVLPGQPTFN